MSRQPQTRHSLHWVRVFGWLTVAAMVAALGVTYWLSDGSAESSRVSLQPADGLITAGDLPELPIYGELPSFELVNTQGDLVSLETLKGKPFIADFVFTRCQGTCPVLSRKMAQLQSRLPQPPPVRFLSFSVDPDHDTPEVLAEYAESLGAGPDWWFLSGDRERTYDLIRRGFKLGVSQAEESPSSAAEPIVHSTRFVLVDSESRIRGYYEAFEPEKLDQLLLDLEQLL
ncbi:MAG: SCO family protein [Acidobacteriota bacterium]